MNIERPKLIAIITGFSGLRPCLVSLSNFLDASLLSDVSWSSSLSALVSGGVVSEIVGKDFTSTLTFDNEKFADEIKKVSGWTFIQVLKIIHPIMPFISEKLWRSLVDDKSYLMNQVFQNYSTNNSFNSSKSLLSLPISPQAPILRFTYVTLK